jgi:hypothetical protein
MAVLGPPAPGGGAKWPQYGNARRERAGGAPALRCKQGRAWRTVRQLVREAAQPCGQGLSRSRRGGCRDAGCSGRGSACWAPCTQLTHCSCCTSSGSSPSKVLAAWAVPCNPALDLLPSSSLGATCTLHQHALQAAWVAQVLTVSIAAGRSCTCSERCARQGGRCARSPAAHVTGTVRATLPAMLQRSMHCAHWGRCVSRRCCSAL